MVISDKTNENVVGLCRSCNVLLERILSRDIEMIGIDYAKVCRAHELLCEVIKDIDKPELPGAEIIPFKVSK